MIDVLLNNLPEKYVVNAKSLLDKLGFSVVDELINVYPVVREVFFNLLDNGVINQYLKSNNLRLSKFPYASNLIELMRFMPLVDECNPIEVYSLLVIASQLNGGCFDLFYLLGVDGSNTDDVSKQLFYPLRKPFFDKKDFKLSGGVKVNLDYSAGNFNNFSDELF